MALTEIDKIEEAKAKKKLHNQQYYAKNREARLNHVKEKYVENKVKILEYKKRYHEQKKLEINKPPRVLSEAYEKQKEAQKRYRERKKQLKQASLEATPTD